MNSAVIAVVVTVLFLLGYRFYATHLAARIFEVGTNGDTPSHRYEDGVDFVPSPPWMLFGHHFASIAGLGPIAGPAIAVIWGWVPALAWVVIGSLFLGAVHDFAALAMSLKHDGKSIGDLTGVILGARGRVLFLIVTFFLLALAMGVFALIVAQIFAFLYPQTVIPVFTLIVVAVLMGYAIYRLKVGIFPATVAGLALTFLAVWVGINHPVSLHGGFLSEKTRTAIAASVSDGSLDRTASAGATKAWLASQGLTGEADDVNAAATRASNIWIYILLAYACAASILPVWLLLQPRDYLNSYQLYIGIGALFIGLLVAHSTIVAPAVNFVSVADPSVRLPSFFPLLFITIACGAISGFHNLVASGTTARQLDLARQARPIAYGGMLVEGLLAVIVLMACTAGVGTYEKWASFYPGWAQLTGTLVSQLAAFFYGAATFLEVFHVPRPFGQAVVAVVVVGFAMTTLDTGTRLLRYNIQELAEGFGLKRFVNRYLASILAVIVLGAVALLKIPAAGPDGAVVMKPAGLVIWQLFGTANQLLACLGLLIATVYLIKVGKPSFYTALPFAFMLLVSGWSLVENILKAWSAAKPELRSWPVCTVGAVLMVVTFWLAVEALFAVRRYKRAAQSAA
mgnify:CR=1 FL=1